MYNYFNFNFSNINFIKNQLKLFFFNKSLFLNYKNNYFIKKNNYRNLNLNFLFFYNLFSKKFKNSNFFHLNFFNKNLNNFKKFKNYKNKFYLEGLNSFIYFFKYILLSLFVIIFIIYFSLIIKSIPFNKIMFAWVSVIMFVYWLISGFVFFFKKYQFGKYTSVIQRFWKRTYILFWLIEGATFSVFLFFTLNASQESIYMFDQISIFKSHLYSWKFFLLKLFPITLLVIIIYLLLINIKYNFYSKFSLLLLFITFFLTNLLWLEFYQFFHVINFYSNINWIYDQDENFWILEQEPRKTRIVNHYVMILFILKFWHIVFIYGFWIFFILRSYEIKRLKYSLLTANFQNFIILYIFTWVFMYPWFKFFFKNLLESPYYWFYINNRKLFFRILLNDFKLYFYSFYKPHVFFFNFNNYNFIYNLNFKNVNFEGFKKNIVSNKILNFI